MSRQYSVRNGFFQAQNTLALLSLMGFDGLQVREDDYVSFRFCGEVYETARLERRACLGIRREVYSCEEYQAVMEAGDEMMGANPNIQCLFSDCNFARIRLWVPCPDANCFFQQGSSLLSDKCVKLT